MRKFEAATLEDAYTLAAEAFSCSITELKTEIIQNPSKGFLGFGSKRAIIVAQKPIENRVVEPKKKPLPSEEKIIKKASQKKVHKPKTKPEHKPYAQNRQTLSANPEEIPVFKPSVSSTEEVLPEFKTQPSTSKKEIEPQDMFENFYSEKPDIHDTIDEIHSKINKLFANSCFDINDIKISAFDDQTVYVEFTGNDAALLIGKEGYRYKALSYLLYNWIHGKYGFHIRLEIAEFLKNQEDMIDNYLQPIIDRVREEGRASTKALDGILVQIALKQLRDIFPDKYVAIRTNRDGGRYVIINDFMERR